MSSKFIITTTETMKKLYNSDNSEKLSALYNFYVYTAMWQDTDRIRATRTYASDVLNLSVPTVRKVHNKLIEKGVIEDIARNQRDKGKFAKKYIKVKYIPWKLVRYINKRFGYNIAEGEEPRYTEKELDNVLSSVEGFAWVNDVSYVGEDYEFSKEELGERSGNSYRSSLEGLNLGAELTEKIDGLVHKLALSALQSLLAKEHVYSGKGSLGEKSRKKAEKKKEKEEKKE